MSLLERLTLEAARAARRQGTAGLLADVPRSRRDDPETSHTAAEAIRRTGELGKQQLEVLAAVKAHPGKTAVELAHLAHLDRYAVSRRLPELAPTHVRRGEIRDCSYSCRPMVTWWPAERST